MDQVFATVSEPIQYGHIMSETLIPPSSWAAVVVFTQQFGGGLITG